MAYRKEKQRVLAGSLNLLPPGDKIPDGDSLALVNWRVDQAGQLRSRRAIHVLGTVPGGGAVHTLFVSGIHNYAVAGGSLYNSFETPSLMASGFSGNPMGIASYGGFVWFMDRSKQGKVRFPWDTLRPWTPVAPTSAPAPIPIGDGREGEFNGHYTYYYTFEDDFGHESNPSLYGPTPVACENSPGIRVGSIAQGPQFTKKRHLYRIGGGSDQVLRVATLNDNVHSSWEDTLSVADAQAINIEMPLDHDPAPPCAGLVGPYFGKLIAFNSEAHPNRIWWTPTGRPWYFPGSDDDSEGNWEDVGEDGEAILAVTLHKTMVVVYKERSIWRYRGDPDENSPEQTNAVVGICGGMRAVTSLGSVDFFGAAEGVYDFNGDFERKLTGKIDPMFHDEWTEIGQDLWAQPMNFDFRRQCAMGVKDGRVYFSYPDTGLTPTATLIYDAAQQRWCQMKVDAAVGGSGFNAFYYDGSTGRLYGAIGSRVAIIESGYYTGEDGVSDDNHAIALLWQSGYLDQGLPDNQKVYADLVIEYRTATVETNQTPATLNVGLLLDYGAVQPVGTLSSRTRTTATFRLGPNGEGLRGKKIAVRIDGNAKANVIIFGVYLHYYVEARAGKSFDTGVVDLGTARPKQFDAIELNLISSGPVAWRFYSDLPGGAMVLRASGTIASSAGLRATIEQLLGSVIDGRHVRLTLGSDQPFQLWGLRLRSRPISVYVDGTVGASWETPDLTFGFEHVKLFREIEFHVDTDGPELLDVFTDLPGDRMDRRFQWNLYTDSTTAGSRTQNIRLPGTTKAKLFKLRVHGPNIARIYGARVFAKVVGVAEPASWVWLPIPMEETPEIFAWVDLPVDAIE